MNCIILLLLLFCGGNSCGNNNSCGSSNACGARRLEDPAFSRRNDGKCETCGCEQNS